MQNVSEGQKEMKKPPKVEFPQIKGWTLLTGVRAHCQACGHLRTFEEAIYWAKDKDRVLIRCEGCAKEEPGR